MMNEDSVIGLVNNAALLLASGLLCDMMGFGPRARKPVFRRILAGVLAGGIGIALMLNPWNFGQGIVFDTRSVLLSVVGYFFGAVPVIPAVLMTAAFRLFMGGAGAWTGVAVIVTSGGIGWTWGYFRRDRNPYPSAGELYLLGIVVHAAMLIWMLSLPRETVTGVLSAIGLPVMLILPPATAVLGKLMVNREKRMESETDLRRSEEKFRSIFQNHSAVKLLIDPATGRIVQANPAAEAFYGWTSAELGEMRIQDINILSPEQVKAEMAAAVSRSRTCFQFRHRRADGFIRDVEVYSSSVEVDGKELLHSIIHDVTERIRSRDLLSNLARLVPGVIYQFRLYPDGRSAFPYASPGMNDIYEVTPEEVREDATPVYGRLHPDDHDQVVDAIRESARTLGAFHCEFRVILPRQGLRWRWSRAHPERTIDGGVLWHGIILDVTERVRSEEALREKEEFRQAMIAASPLAMISYATDGSVLSWNRAAERIFGWTEAEVLGRFVPTVPVDRHEEFARLRESVIEGATFSRIEMKRQRKDGSLIDVSLSTAPIRDKEGRGAAIMAVLEDITERKRVEQEREKLQGQLLQARKMESVGRLAGGVAHDYNNMLGVILGYTELALEKLGPDDILRPDLEEVMSAAKRSTDITRQLLAFSRQQTIAPRVIDLNETVESMLKMLRRLIGEDIDLSWHPGAGAGPVFIDPTQLDQILVNLCVNARDAIADVGKITIETDAKTFDDSYCVDHFEFVPGDYILLSVSDDGCGMDPATRERIFEPFFTTKEMGEGTGLGLATVYGIIKQNNGFINIYSEPNQGTVFRIYLPRHEAAVERSQARGRTGPDAGGSETVLLVEDDRTILKMTARMLERLGYRVLTANHAREAEESVQSHAGEIRLLMTDVVMPGMNGRELAERIRTLRPDIEVLFMSGYTANVIAHRGVLYDGVNFIQKPFAKQDLAVKIRDILETAK
jgi:two-component system, cell cycle sensor histidine kinase and response regulator CckA